MHWYFLISFVRREQISFRMKCYNTYVNNKKEESDKTIKFNDFFT